VLNALVKHCTRVFEQEPIPPNIEPTLAIDIEAGIDLKAAHPARDLGYRHGANLRSPLSASASASAR
jgi:hypothetical protein